MFIVNVHEHLTFSHLFIAFLYSLCNIYYLPFSSEWSKLATSSQIKTIFPLKIIHSDSEEPFKYQLDILRSSHIFMLISLNTPKKKKTQLPTQHLTKNNLSFLFQHQPTNHQQPLAPVAPPNKCCTMSPLDSSHVLKAPRLRLGSPGAGSTMSSRLR